MKVNDMAKNEITKQKSDNKYCVYFVPHYDLVKDWYGRRLAARRNSKDKFTKSEAEKVVKFLKKRGDKAIRVKKVKPLNDYLRKIKSEIEIEMRDVAQLVAEALTPGEPSE